MDSKELRNLLAKRLYLELQLFKYATLQQTREEIYRTSYKIEILENVYEILLEDMENMEIKTVCVLLYQAFGILEYLYQEWLSKEDGAFRELQKYVKVEMHSIAQINGIESRKERTDESGYNQAA